MSEKAVQRLIAALVLVTSFTVYALTMAATTSLWDSGEFIATSYILGIPHSPGTPLYVLVGRVFCLLPLAISTARKVNLLSVTFGALGVLMAYLVMVMVVRFMFQKVETFAGRFARLVGPLVGALFLTFSDTHWTDSTEAEVYALSAFVMGLCTLLALKWLMNPSGRLDEDSRKKIMNESGRNEGKKLIETLEKENLGHSRNLVFLIIYLIAMGIGFHLGTILVYGGIFLMFLMVKEKSFTNFEISVFTFGLAVLVADMTLYKQSNVTIFGLLIFAALIIWCLATRGKFALIATALFVLGISVHLFMLIRSGLDPAIDEVDPETWKSLYAHLRREQYPPMSIFTRKASFIFQLQHFGTYFREQFRLFGDVYLGRLNLGQASVVIPSVVGLYGILTNYYREKKTWVLNVTSLLLNSLGLIIFLNFSADEVRERDYFYGGAFYYFAVFIGIGATSLMMLMLDEAKRVGGNLKRFVVPVGIFLVVCSILPAGYGWHKHDRSHNYIPRDYAYNMLAGLEPDAILITNGDNDTFPLWYIQYVEYFRTDVRVVNRMLLNTPWYMKQVRDLEPKVPFNLTDPQIDALTPVRDARDGSIIWTYQRAIQQIIQANAWRKPIYFAVTAPAEVWEPYADYLILEGMVRRLVPTKGSNMIDEFMLERNFSEIFIYRGLLDKNGELDTSIYRSPDTDRLFSNFALAASQLAVTKSREHDDAAALHWAEMSLKFLPDYEWARRYLGLYYMRNGQPDKAIEHYLHEIARSPERGEFRVGLAASFENAGLMDQALATLKEAAVMTPGNKDVFIQGFRIAGSMGLRDDAVGFIKSWLERHPGDREFASLYMDIDSVLLEEFGIAPPESSSGR